MGDKAEHFEPAHGFFIMVRKLKKQVPYNVFIGNMLSKDVSLVLVEEEWKDIEGSNDDYMISSFGRLYSKKRSLRARYGYRIKNGHLMNLCKDKDGYLITIIRVNGKSINVKIHRLVAQHFILNPENKPEVNHINGMKSFNYKYNLEWATSSENRIHAYKTGLQKPLLYGGWQDGEKQRNSKLTNEMVLEIRSYHKKMPYKDIAIKFNISRQYVESIINRRKWTCI